MTHSLLKTLQPSPRRLAALCVAAACALTAAGTAQAQPSQVSSDVGIDQKLDAQLPLDLPFRDQDGRDVLLGDYFGSKPVILTPVYYRCPMLCGLELNGLVRALRGMQLTVGQDFQIVTYSIHPQEKPPLASQKRKTYLAQYGRDAAEEGWCFLTGNADAIARLNDAIGFRTRHIPQTDDYSHAAGIVVCTPQGRTARYFFGVEFAPKFLRLALVEASRNQIGTLTDQVMLFCYMYDPARGKYGLAILNLVRAGGVLTVLAMAFGITRMLKRERLQKHLAEVSP